MGPRDMTFNEFKEKESVDEKISIEYKDRYKKFFDELFPELLLKEGMEKGMENTFKLSLKRWQEICCKIFVRFSETLTEET